MKEELLKLLDECIDQEKLAKGLVRILVAPKLAQLKEEVKAHQIDLVKGTEMDAELIVKAIEAVEAKLV